MRTKNPRFKVGDRVLINKIIANVADDPEEVIHLYGKEYPYVGTIVELDEAELGNSRNEEVWDYVAMVEGSFSNSVRRKIQFWLLDEHLDFYNKQPENTFQTTVESKYKY